MKAVITKVIQRNTFSWNILETRKSVPFLVMSLKIINTKAVVQNVIWWHPWDPCEQMFLFKKITDTKVI